MMWFLKGIIQLVSIKQAKPFEVIRKIYEQTFRSFEKKKKINHETFFLK